MKIAKIIIAAAASATMLASCSNPLETQLMGTWTLQKCEIPNLDSLCQVRAAEDVESTNKAIELLRHQLDSTKSADKRKDLMDQEKQLIVELDSCTPQNIKKEYTALCNEKIGALSISFKENKQIQIHVPGTDEQFGTWRVKGDSVITMFDNQPAEIMIVKDVSSKTLILYSPAPDERLVSLIMTLGKQ